MKQLVSKTIGLGLSLILVAWMVVFVNWSEVWQRLLTSNYWALIPASFVIILHYFLRAWRWRLLLPQCQNLKFRALFDGIMVGNFASYFLPLRAGEFVRPFVLARGGSHSFSAAFSSVVIERFFDLTAVLLTFVYVVYHVDTVPAILHKGALVLLILALLILSFILIGIFLPEIARRLVGSGLKLLPLRVANPLQKFLYEFIAGTQVLKDFRRFVGVIVLTCLVWFSCYVLFVVFNDLVRIPEVVGFSKLFVATTVAVVVALAVAAPSSPGFVGVYQAGCTAGYAMFGIDAQAAITFAILSHVYQYLLFGFYGFYYLISNGLRFDELRQAVGKK